MVATIHGCYLSQTSTDRNPCIQQGMRCSLSRDIKKTGNTYQFKINNRNIIEKSVKYAQR